MHFYLIIPTVIIIILMMPIFLEFKVTFDAKTFSGVVSVFLFKIKLRHLIFRFSKGKLIIQDEKSQGQEFDADSREVVFYKALFSEVKDKTRLKELFVFYNIGFGDAFVTAMVCGAINSALLIFFTAIKNQKPTASLGVYDTVSYNRDLCEFAVKSKISVTIFDMLYALLMAYITSVRFVHQKNAEMTGENLSQKRKTSME